MSATFSPKLSDAATHGVICRKQAKRRARRVHALHPWPMKENRKFNNGLAALFSGLREI